MNFSQVQDIIITRIYKKPLPISIKMHAILIEYSILAMNRYNLLFFLISRRNIVIIQEKLVRITVLKYKCNYNFISIILDRKNREA